VVSADVVTADAHLVTASATENEDFLWGIRGAGANFGVVTSFEYQLHPVGSFEELCIRRVGIGAGSPISANR
jgi:FAD/FMN-containing dehydrogenase